MRTNVRVGAIIRKDNTVLLIHRFKMGEEYWVLPGGGVESEESVDEALLRELMEETSLSVEKFTFLAEHTRESGIKHLFYEVSASGEPMLSGPEKEGMSDDNQYILEWIDVETAKKFEYFYPEEVQKYF